MEYSQMTTLISQFTYTTEKNGQESVKYFSIVRCDKEISSSGATPHMSSIPHDNDP